MAVGRAAPRARALATTPHALRLIYFDLETSGLSKARSRVIEIAALDPASGASMSTLVNPGDGHRLPRQVTELTGIAHADVQADGVPTFGAALDALVAFAGEEALLCAHNCRAFDAPFLAAEAARSGRTLPAGWRFVDSLEVARALFAQPWVPARPARMSLDALAVFLGVVEADGARRPETKHRALADCRLLVSVLDGLDMRFGLGHLAFAGRAFALGAEDVAALALPTADDADGGAADERAAAAAGVAPAGGPAAAGEAASELRVLLWANAHEWELPAMMRHYLAVKQRHAHALLLFRVGDFFEAYFDDAAVLAGALRMELTRKRLRPRRAGGGADSKEEVAVPMAGFPHAALEKHARALLAHGHSVALCQQYVVDARSKTVRRSLERVLTPGTVFDEWLDASNNFVAALLPAQPDQGKAGAGGAAGGAALHGLVYADVTTGELWATASASGAALADELARVAPSEVLLPAHAPSTGGGGGDDALAAPRYVLPGHASSSPDVPSWAPASARYLVLPRADFEAQRSCEAIGRHYGPAVPLQAVGLGALPNAQAALGALLRYVHATTAAEDGGGEDEEEARARPSGMGRGLNGNADADEADDDEAASAQPQLGAADEQSGATFARARAARLRLPRVYSLEDSMAVDEAARRNLELEVTARSGERRGSLLWALDCTQTPMGGRLLRRWLLRPSLSVAAIRARHAAVGALAERHGARAQLRRALRGVRDLERLLTRVETRRASPRCVGSVGTSLLALESVDAVLRAAAGTAAPGASGVGAPTGGDWGAAGSGVDGGEAAGRALLAPPSDGSAARLAELSALIRSTLVDNPPPKLGDGDCISQQAAAVHPPLLAARAAAAEAAAWLAGVEAREQEASGLPSVRALSVRGELVLSVKGTAALARLADGGQKGAAAKAGASGDGGLPAGWLEVPCAVARSKERRFVTAEIRSAEARLAAARARAVALEARLFDELLDAIEARAPDVRAACARVARADVLAAFAQTAVSEGYCRPAVLPMGGGPGGAEHVLRVERARHPVVERLLPAGAFVPNPICLGGTAPAFKSLLVLTGPNAGGKSVYLRTLGVLQIMAQAGSFVPADAATLSVADRLFTRVGAVDDIGGGQSTFTVEMRETAEILRHATAGSLVLLDEVGRGTAAADGVAIARAVAEHLASAVRCRALFATHLHELSALATQLPNVGAAQMGVVPREPEEGGADEQAVELTYRLLPGAATSSYGLHAARVAGFPPSVLQRAHELLTASSRGEPLR